jgi:hypothetical protein
VVEGEQQRYSKKKLLGVKKILRGEGGTPPTPAGGLRHATDMVYES